MKVDQLYLSNLTHACYNSCLFIFIYKAAKMRDFVAQIYAPTILTVVDSGVACTAVIVVRCTRVNYFANRLLAVPINLCLITDQATEFVYFLK